MRLIRVLLHTSTRKMLDVFTGKICSNIGFVRPIYIRIAHTIVAALNFAIGKHILQQLMDGWMYEWMKEFNVTFKLTSDY